MSASIFARAASAAAASALAVSAAFRASSRSLMACSSCRADMSMTLCSSTKLSRSSAGTARSIRALDAPKSANVFGFDHSRANFMNFWAVRSESSTRSLSQGSHSPWESIPLASMSRAPMSRMASPASRFRSRISPVTISMVRGRLILASYSASSASFHWARRRSSWSSISQPGLAFAS